MRKETRYVEVKEVGELSVGQRVFYRNGLLGKSEGEIIWVSQLGPGYFVKGKNIETEEVFTDVVVWKGEGK